MLTPGQLLQQAREEQGLTVAEVAQKLNLRLAVVQDLEANRFDRQLVTFTRGYLKAYAKLLEIPESQVMQALDKINPSKVDNVAMQSFSKRTSKQSSERRLMEFTYFIVVLLIALMVVWWIQQSDSDSAVSADGNKAEQTLPQFEPGDKVSLPSQSSTEVPSAEPATDSENSPDVVIESKQKDAHSAASVETQQEMVIDADAQPAQDDSVDVASMQSVDVQSASSQSAPWQAGAALAERATLKFHFDKRVWVQVVDARGRKLAYGEKASGYNMKVSGKPPFELIFAKPDGITIRYDDDQVDLSRFISGKMAKFSLPFAQ